MRVREVPGRMDSWMGGSHKGSLVEPSRSWALSAACPCANTDRLPAPPAALPQTLRAYVGMLRMEDRLYAHPTYLKGMSGAISAYLRLHDSAAAGGGPADEEALLAAMSAEEQKK